ncbi:MAG: hypothetical protein K8T26_05650 [Lentisphaerae bacterium]|nr:hypothetical protein [Lentisphaerota bacterium]
MKDYSGRNRRRNVMSLPGTQLRIILFFAVLALLYALVNVYVSKHAFQRLAAEALRMPLPMTAHRDLQVIVYEQEATLDVQLSLFTFLSFSMLCLAGVLISHRIGGPVYHLKNYLDGLGSGAQTPRLIKFRKDDFFHDLADTFNRFQEREGIVKPSGGQPPVEPTR